MCQAITTSVCATAKIALPSDRVPKRLRNRRNCTEMEVSRVRTPAQAASQKGRRAGRP